MTIIHRQHRFIYLKSFKTAGTSVEAHLLTRTRLGGDLWSTSSEILNHGLPQKSPKTALFVWRGRVYAFNRRSLLVRAWSDRWRPRIVEHQTASDLASQLGEFWLRAIKVTSVRNPWDILVSAWQWRRDGRGGRAEPIDTGFHAWASAALSGDDDMQKRCGAYDARNLMHPFVLIDGKVAIDHFIRQEAINDGLDSLSKQLGLKLGHIAIREKTSSRTRDYRPYYNEALADQVAVYFSDFIELTQYSFE